MILINPRGTRTNEYGRHEWRQYDGPQKYGRRLGGVVPPFMDSQGVLWSVSKQEQWRMTGRSSKFSRIIFGRRTGSEYLYERFWDGQKDRWKTRLMRELAGDLLTAYGYEHTGTKWDSKELAWRADDFGFVVGVSRWTKRFPGINLYINPIFAERRQSDDED